MNRRRHVEKCPQAGQRPEWCRTKRPVLSRSSLAKSDISRPLRLHASRGRRSAGSVGRVVLEHQLAGPALAHGPLRDAERR